MQGGQTRRRAGPRRPGGRDADRSGRTRNEPRTRTWGIEGAGRVQCMLGRLDAALSRFDEAVGTTGDDLTRLDGLAWGALARAQAGDSETARAGLAQLLSV